MADLNRRINKLDKQMHKSQRQKPPRIFIVGPDGHYNKEAVEAAESVGEEVLLVRFVSPVANLWNTNDPNPIQEDGLCWIEPIS